MTTTELIHQLKVHLNLASPDRMTEVDFRQLQEDLDSTVEKLSEMERTQTELALRARWSDVLAEALVQEMKGKVLALRLTGEAAADWPLWQKLIAGAQSPEEFLRLRGLINQKFGATFPNRSLAQTVSIENVNHKKEIVMEEFKTGSTPRRRHFSAAPLSCRRGPG
jgi:hypothetical protein